MLRLLPLISIPGKGLPTWCRHLWNKKSQRCSRFANEKGIALFHPHIEEKHNAYKVSLTMSHLRVIFEGSGIAASALMPALPMLWRSRFQSKITQVCINKIPTLRPFRINWSFFYRKIIGPKIYLYFMNRWYVMHCGHNFRIKWRWHSTCASFNYKEHGIIYLAYFMA